MKKIEGAVWESPAKQHSQSSPFPPKLGWIGCAIQQAAPKQLPQFFPYFQHTYFFNYLIKNPQTTIALTFLTHIISGIGGVLEQYILDQKNATVVSIYFLGISIISEYYMTNTLTKFKVSDKNERALMSLFFT